MICPKCKKENEDIYQFCLQCGEQLSHETQNPDEDETVIVRHPVINTGLKSSKTPLILLGALAAILIGVLGFTFLPSIIKKTTPTPADFGVFNQKNDTLAELRLREYPNLLKGRDELKDDSSLPVTDASANLIVYHNQQTIPKGDLKIIKLDSIKDDGKIDYWEPQPSPIDGNSEMNQIKVRPGLPKGRFALVLLKGHLDEGTHKLWAFQVENGAGTPADPETLTLTLKPTPTATPTPQVITKIVPVPQSNTNPQSSPNNILSPGQIGICTTDKITSTCVLRYSDTQKSEKIGNIARGDTVMILGYSPNLEWFGKKRAGWYYVRTRSGTGYVFAHYIR